MAKKKKSKAQVGDIYVVTNDCYVKHYSPLAKMKVRPVKIGRAKDCVIRVGNMSSSVFEDFTCHLVLRAQDVVRCEDDIHDLFKDYRIFTKKSGGKTEFFHCPLEEVFARIKKYVAKNPDRICITEDNGIKGRSIGRSATSQVSMRKKQSEAKMLRRKQSAKGKVASGRKPAIAKFNFAMVGLSKGARLVFIPTGDKVTVFGSNQVKRNGEVLTLTGYATKYMPKEKRNSKDSYQGPAYFAYKGKKLTKLREEMGQG